MHRLTLIFFVALFFAARPAMAQSYEIAVEHDHTFGACRGKLIVTQERIEYRTEYKGHSRKWLYTDLRQIKIVSPKRIELASYEDRKWRMGRDRIFEFKLLEGEITPAISGLLVERAARPVVTSVAPKTDDAPAFEVPVKHLHRFGGCIGALKIYPDRVIYESQDMPSDSRYWRYGDIQNISQSERYRFEIVTFEDRFGGPKTYNFQLRESLPAQAYDYVWERVYPSKFHSGDESSEQVGRPATSSERRVGKP
jgi:hypothetical protein